MEAIKSNIIDPTLIREKPGNKDITLSRNKWQICSVLGHGIR